MEGAVVENQNVFAINGGFLDGQGGLLLAERFLPEQAPHESTPIG
jgi:hypothetical protein